MAPSLEELRCLLRGHETAGQLFERLAREPLWTSVPPLDAAELRPGHVVEVEGLSGSGKSEVLLQVRVVTDRPQ